jgi:hypothetical protein
MLFIAGFFKEKCWYVFHSSLVHRGAKLQSSLSFTDELKTGKEKRCDAVKDSSKQSGRFLILVASPSFTKTIKTLILELPYLNL